MVFNAFLRAQRSLVKNSYHTIDSSGRILWIRLDLKRSEERGRLNAKEIVFNTIKFKIFNSLGL